MIDLLLIAAAATPRVFANEYCWARRYGANHQEALVQAEASWGGLKRTESADRFINKYCPTYTKQT